VPACPMPVPAAPLPPATPVAVPVEPARPPVPGAPVAPAPPAPATLISSVSTGVSSDERPHASTPMTTVSAAVRRVAGGGDGRGAGVPTGEPEYSQIRPSGGMWQFAAVSGQPRRSARGHNRRMTVPVTGLALAVLLAGDGGAPPAAPPLVSQPA